MSQCTDRVVGNILAGWRYDISGITPEMRGDYEAHLAACEHCRSRQRLHRTIDISLIVLATVSACVFLLAYGVIRHFEPRHTLIFELIAIGGFLIASGYLLYYASDWRDAIRVLHWSIGLLLALPLLVHALRSGRYRNSGEASPSRSRKSRR